MPEVTGGGVVGARSGLGWRKSGRSNPSGNCVELAELATDEIAVRNSRQVDGPVLVYTRAEIAAFIAGAKDGDFDDLLGCTSGSRRAARSWASAVHVPHWSTSDWEFTDMITAQPNDDPGQARLLPLSDGGPTVLRIALGGQLRRLRQDRGISREAAGEAIRGSHAKISRLELGRVGFKERDITDLLTLYGVIDPAERDAFLTLARQANAPGWWHQYGDLLPSWFETYLGLEQAATIIRTYEAQFIPGLLQTPDYARAVIRLSHGHEPAEEIDRRVALRMRRQAILTRTDPPNLWVVLDEAALHRPFGGVPVLRAQLEHLIQATELPNVTVQLLPYHVGGHAAAGGPFTILRFPESDLPDIVYLEQLTSALYLDKRQDLDRYLAVMDRVSVQAEPPQQTPRILTSLLAELNRSSP